MHHVIQRQHICHRQVSMKITNIKRIPLSDIDPTGVGGSGPAVRLASLQQYTEIDKTRYYEYSIKVRYSKPKLNRG